MRRLLFVGIWLYLSTLPANANVIVHKNLRYFDLGIQIRTWLDVREAMSRRGPFSKKLGHRAWGQAHWSFKPRYKVVRKGGKCSIRNLNLHVNITLKIPQMLYVNNGVDKTARKVFSCISKTVRKHEETHADIAIRVAYELEKTLLSQMQSTSCDGFSQRVSNIWGRAYKYGSLRQDRFDRNDYKRRRYDSCWPNRRERVVANIENDFDAKKLEQEQPVGEHKQSLGEDQRREPKHSSSNFIYIICFAMMLVVGFLWA